MSISEIGSSAATRWGLQSQTGLCSLPDPIGRHPALAHARLFPKPARKLDGVDAGRLPPGAFVAGTMCLPMMHAAKRDREFIASFAGKGGRMHVAQMVRIGWLTAADEARLLHDIAKVVAAAVAPRGRNSEDALVDALHLTGRGVFGRGNRRRMFSLRHRRMIVRDGSGLG